MGLVDASTAIGTTTASIPASAGDIMLVMVREIIATPATPSGSGLTAFTGQTLTSGNANNGADTVRGKWYRTVVASSFSGVLTFANNAFGYEIYVESGLDTGGTNGSNAVLQAVGAFDTTPGALTITYDTAILSGNRGIVGFIGAGPNDVEPSTPRSGWTDDFSSWNANTVFVTAHSRTTTDTAASVNYVTNTSVIHGIALELQVASASSVPPGSKTIKSQYPFDPEDPTYQNIIIASGPSPGIQPARYGGKVINGGLEATLEAHRLITYPTQYGVRISKPAVGPSVPALSPIVSGYGFVGVGVKVD